MGVILSELAVSYDWPGRLGGEPCVMLTQEEGVEIHALRKRGWTISEIARHRCRDRKTVWAYLAGDD